MTYGAGASAVSQAWRETPSLAPFSRASTRRRTSSVSRRASSRRAPAEGRSGRARGLRDQRSEEDRAPFAQELAHQPAGSRPHERDRAVRGVTREERGALGLREEPGRLLETRVAQPRAERQEAIVAKRGQGQG